MAGTAISPNFSDAHAKVSSDGLTSYHPIYPTQELSKGQGVGVKTQSSRMYRGAKSGVS